MWRCVLLAGLIATATGCQTFVGIDDVSAHLPYVDGEYLIGLKRQKAAGGDEVIRLRGTAHLDDATRSLTLSISQLAVDDGRSVSENAISGLVFGDTAEVDFDLSIEIRPEAVVALAPADTTVTARMRMTLEGDYALCAVPTTSATLPSIGSILVDSTVATPAATAFDSACDEL